MKKIKIFLFLSLVLVTLFSQNNQYLFAKNPDTNILIITLDTTRADRIGIYGHEPAQTPNIDALARKGILFENAYTPVPLTLPAHCSIFTGTTPLVHRVRNNGRQEEYGTGKKTQLSRFLVLINHYETRFLYETAGMETVGRPETIDIKRRPPGGQNLYPERIREK